MKRKNLYLITFLGLSGIAVACGGKGDETDGGDGDGDGDVGDGDVGDGDVGDGDVGDGDVGDGDVGDGDVGDGDMTVGGAGGMTAMGGTTAMGGVASTDGTCGGTADACVDQGDNCTAAGCDEANQTGICNGNPAFCLAHDNQTDCDDEAGANCTWNEGAILVCSGVPSDCDSHTDDVTCESVGCTWTAN